MQPFTRLTAVAAPIELPNIDTDRIIPARFLRRPRESGVGPLLFHDVRFDATGGERADFCFVGPVAVRSRRTPPFSYPSSIGRVSSVDPWSMAMTKSTPAAR